MSDILMANKEIYQMVGNFGESKVLIDENGEEMATKMLKLTNADLFTKRCLLPLDSSSPDQVAQKI